MIWGELFGVSDYLCVERASFGCLRAERAYCGLKEEFGGGLDKEGCVKED